MTSDKIKEENWKNKTVKAEGKCGKLNPNIQEFKLRLNYFDVIDNGSHVNVFHACAINSLIHGLQHLEKKFNFLSDRTNEYELFTCAKRILAETQYSKTNEMLYDFIMKHTLYSKKDGKLIDCWNSVGHIIDLMLEDNIEISCKHCKSKSKLRCLQNFFYPLYL